MKTIEARHMKRKNAEETKTPGTSLVRASISFQPGLYETLDGIATQKKISLACVVRDAAEKYVGGRCETAQGKTL